MTTSDESLALHVPLRVRTLRVLHADGTTTRTCTVRCTRTERSVPLRECITCDHSQGLTNDDARQPVACCTHVTARLRVASRPQIGAALGCVSSSSVAVLVPLHEVMTAEVLTVRDDLGVEALTGLLLERGIHGVPVVDDAGRVIGMASRTDLVRDHFERGCIERDPSPWSELTGRSGPRRPPRPGPAAVVAELMVSSPVTLCEDASLAEAAALMAREGMHRIPVVSIDGHVVGILSSLDVAAWLGQPV